jgi:Flp pilus assembly protein TadD
MKITTRAGLVVSREAHNRMAKRGRRYLAANSKGPPAACVMPASSSGRIPGPLTLAFLGCAAVAGLILYGPAFHGSFVFDDSVLPFYHSLGDESASAFLAASGVRPVLMFSYWLNRTISGESPFGYHAVNLLIHIVNTGLVLLVIWRLLGWANWAPTRRKWTSIAGATVFLIHPLQTEAVSYVAGRSESLSMLFVLAAYTLFLYRGREEISWLEAVGVLALFGIAVGAKENAVSLAGILILTDVFWPAPFSTAGLKRNWRLYLLMLPGAAAAAVWVFRILAAASSAGFSMRDFTWYEYAFTEARAIFTYIRLSVLPIGLSVDHDFAKSNTILRHGAIFWILLLAVLVYSAVRLRHKYPLACFGLLLYLIALAPTSSIVPIADPLVERRMYLPIVGLVLIGCDLSRRVNFSSPVAWGTVAVVFMGLAASCYARSQAWGHPEQLFADAAMASTHNVRPYLNLTEILVHENRCGLAIPHLERADRLFRRNYSLQMAWAWALECMGEREKAMQRLRAAAEIRPSSRVYEQMGLLYGEMGQSTDAGRALQTAVDLDATSASAHDALALWYESVHKLKEAEAEYEKGISLDRNDASARAGLLRVRASRGAAAQ